MFGLLFFIPTFVFLVLAIVFPLAISNVEKMPKAVNLNIGNLNAKDIRKLDHRNRIMLRNHLTFCLLIAVAITSFISFLFIVFGSADNALLALPCNLMGTVVGLSVVFQCIKKANALKKTL